MESSHIEPLSGNATARDLTDWFERFELWTVTRKDIRDSNKVAFLLTYIGKEIYTLIKDLAFPQPPKDCAYEQIKDLLHRHFLPVNFEATERAKFHGLIRQPQQSYRDFVLQIQRQAAKCAFRDSLPEQLRDRLVAGINNSELQRKLLLTSDLTFVKAKEICELQDDVTHALVEQTSCLQIRTQKRSQPSRPPKGPSRKPISSPSPMPTGKCMSCNGPHLRKNCRFRDAVCHFCKLKGHISSACRKRTKALLTQTGQEIERPTSSTADELPLVLSTRNELSKHRITYTARFPSGAVMPLILDTGSAENIISETLLLKECPSARITPTTMQIYGITGHLLPIIGKTNISLVDESGQIHSVEFIVIPRGPSLLGMSGITEMGVSFNCSDCLNCTPSTHSLFQECCSLKGGMVTDPVSINVEGAPVFAQRRILPYGLREPVKKALEDLVADGILSPVSESAWASPIVPVRKKSGEVRICGDYKETINPKLKQCGTTLREPEDLLNSLRGSKIYSKLDLANAFLQLPLDTESKSYTTINTPFGLYCYNFLPFGLSCSPQKFQSCIDKVIAGLEHVESYQDDLIVYSENAADHDKHLRDVLLRLREYNIKVNAEKSVLMVKELSYLGYRVNGEGYSPDPDRLRPIVEAPRPTSHSGLKSLIGCYQYYSRFIPNFSSVAEPLFALQTASDFVWTEQHTAAIDKLRDLLVQLPILRPFSPNITPTLITDASPDGLGCVLEQEGRPVICISRRLSKAERGYSQTQREALAVHWGITRLHKFLYGIKFKLVSDHQALQYIFSPSKGINKSSAAMIQRWSVQLSAYNYEIEFRPGKQIPQADFLSRYAAFDQESETDDTALLTNPLPFTREALREETKKFFGDILAALKNGWRSSTKRKHPQFYSLREDISVTPDQVLYYNDRVIVPPTLRKVTLQDLHSSHLGVEKLKSLARLSCWWPSLNADIANFVKDCTQCHTKPKPSQWTPWPSTYEPWQRVHVDYCGPLLNKYYVLVLIDAYSKWPEIFTTTTANAEFTIRALRRCFSREGVPKCLVCDNGTPFSAEVTRKWLQEIGCRQLFSPPRHPQSNGAAENFVKTVKSAVHSVNPTTLEELEKTLDNLLLQYRNAAHASTKTSPAILFKKRNLRANLHCIDTSDVTFYKGNEFRPSNGIILRPLGNKLVELLDTADGSIHRRHIDQINFPPKSSEDKQEVQQEDANNAPRNSQEELPGSEDPPRTDHPPRRSARETKQTEFFSPK